MHYGSLLLDASRSSLSGRLVAVASCDVIVRTGALSDHVGSRNFDESFSMSASNFYASLNYDADDEDHDYHYFKLDSNKQWREVNEVEVAKLEGVEYDQKYETFLYQELLKVRKENIELLKENLALRDKLTQCRNILNDQ